MSHLPRPVRVLCTLGPASLNRSTIERLNERQVDLLRINLSHTPLDRVATTIETIQAHSKLPICLDTEGAQVRTATMEPDVTVVDAAHVRLTPEQVLGSAQRLTLTPASVFAGLEPGTLIGLDFDGVVLLVVERDADGVNTIVLNGGRIGSNKAAVVTPAPQLPALSEKDRAAVAIGREYGLRHFALSFANSAADVAELRSLVGPDSTIISKIESKRGVLNLDEILQLSDEILIDRGDLSREVPLENIPLLQKAIIRKANLAKKPVNVATNLLESMLVNRKPTRAELNDIINTLLDGANGLVLAAETAIGAHPVGAVDMVLNMIERYCRSVEGHRIEDLLEAGPVLHGHAAAAAFPSRRRSRFTGANASRLPAIEIDEETLLDVEQIASGVFAPLRGFMTQAELASVLETNHLPTGEVWTMPIVLQGKGQEFAAFQPGQSVRLVDQRTGQGVAILHLEDKFEIDPQHVAHDWFGTTDRSHPGVKRLLSRGLTLLGGEIERLEHAASTRSPYQLSPAQARMLLDIKGWSKVVAFHARNLPDRGREHLLAHAAERSHADGVLLQIAVGPQPAGEVASEVVLSAYQRLVQLAYPNSLLSALGAYERYAGPRDAVFAALVSKNFGCTHFVVGRNRADRALFEQLGDLGITPVYFDEICFSEDDGVTVERNGHDADLREFSSSHIRERLARSEQIPAWCMRDELSTWLLSERSAGTSLFAASE